MNSSPRLGGMQVKHLEKVWQPANVELGLKEADLPSSVSAVFEEILVGSNKLLLENCVNNSSDKVKDLENVVAKSPLHLWRPSD